MPRFLIGLAHFEAKARATGRRALRQWEILEQAGCKPHYISSKFLHTTSRLRPDLVRFVGGALLTDLPALHLEVARFARASTTERSIDAKHALMHREYVHAPNASPPTVSLAHRPPELVDRIKHDPNVLAQMAEHLADTCHPINAVQALGLERHPVCEDSLKWRGQDRGGESIVAVPCH